MIEWNAVSKSFGTVRALRDFSLRIGQGEVFGLLGPNGAGKSTAIGVCLGLVRPDSGTIAIAGMGSPDDPRTRRSIGAAPQAIALYDELSGRENLRYFGRLHGLGGSTLTRRVDQVLDEVGLLPRAKDRVLGYSGGMKRRLNLAAAIVHDPPILLLDEPTAGVDPQSRNNILDMCKALSQRGKTIVYTTHYMEEAARLCTRVGIIDHGALLATGTVAHLIAEHGGESVVTITRTDGTETRVATPDPVRHAAGLIGDATVQGLRIDRADLESVFLNLTGRSLRD
ncbi:MAG: ABC transporter ATP-binding protein [Leptolyngbya sp. PLA1]|nr:ABC transporter ATP-binding protein [Leptolyngbya sp. PLA1]